MKSQSWPISRYESITQVTGVVVALIGAAAIAGWFLEFDTLRGLNSSYIPMAPNTALLFVLTGAMLTIRLGPSAKQIVLRSGAIIITLVALARLSEYFTGADFGVDRLVFRFPAETLGLAPVGRMAFFTALTFSFLGAASLLVTSASNWSDTVAKCLSVVVAFIGLSFSLGYVYGAPLMYGGSSIPMALNTAVCFFLSGVGIGIMASLRGLSERRQTAETLLKLASIVESSADAIFGKSLDGIITSWNKGAERIYGYTAEEVVGKPISVLIPPEQGDELRQIHETASRGESLDDYETLRVRKDGNEIYLSLSISPIKDTTGRLTGASIVARDITEQRLAQKALQQAHDELEVRVKERTVQLTQAVASLEKEIADRQEAEEALEKTEEQLRQSQKLEAVGRLAGGIAHDFNNLLTVIIGYSDLISSKGGLDARVTERVEEIHKAAVRASSLTRQLLAFSRKQVLKPQVLDLNELVEGLSKMLSRLIGEDVQIINSLGAGLGKVNADPGQIEQILINLAVNARDAMPDGGQITIKTANAELDQAYSDMHMAIKPGHYVMLAVSDTGLGMDAATRERVFEPFFTTKEVGKGTGLGLSMVYGIVKQSGGNIWVYSEPGHGATFKIYLPLITEESFVNAPIEGTESLVTKATETILLVEDEEMVRKLARDILESRGYRVLSAQNGEEAMTLCQTHREEIQLLLTDVVMPKMNGKKAAEAIMALHPEIVVLYMSGFTDDAIVHHGVLHPGMNFIEKPFTAEVLARKVREVLDKSRTREQEPLLV
ncbi:MAG TPA: PAS domain S-box protein [Pyrinomonadaceae bacterium]|nr:PAS domain S-box protein [Pyrinomonadaceae bacterium]